MVEMFLLIITLFGGIYVPELAFHFLGGHSQISEHLLSLGEGHQTQIGLYFEFPALDNFVHWLLRKEM